MTLTVIGLGHGGYECLTVAMLNNLRGAQKRFVRMRAHPAVQWLESPEGGVKFDAAFDTFENIDAIVEELIEATHGGDVAYVVPGNTLFGDASCLPLIERARTENISIRFLDAAPPAVTDGRSDFAALVAVMARLRDPETGCPWDREQTSHTIKKYLVEETYEVLEAIEGGDPSKLAEELGDLLLQVVFHAQMAADAGQFDIYDVTHRIVEKLVNRHPHVFGDLSVADSDQVLTNWEKIKLAEKGYEDRKSILDGIPAGLPALMRALDVSKRVVKVGFEWPNVDEVLDKVEEEIAELRIEIRNHDTERAAAELGDLFFTLVNVARQLKIDPEEALRHMTDRFGARFRRIEKHAESQGRSVQEMSLTEMEEVWQAAKREEAPPSQ